MNEQVVDLIVGILTVAGTIIAAFITTKSQVSKGIKKISGNLRSWILLYEHDSNGSQIDGNIEYLIEAVGKAYPIKVKVYQSKNRFDMMNAQWIFVEDNLVHATNIEQISITKDQDGRYVYNPDAYHYFVIVNSEGRHHASRVFIDGRKGHTTDDKRRMAWYGLVPPNS